MGKLVDVASVRVAILLAEGSGPCIHTSQLLGPLEGLLYSLQIIAPGISKLSKSFMEE
jgi:hypothetical protein